jgi:hypothetical protein
MGLFDPPDSEETERCGPHETTWITVGIQSRFRSATRTTEPVAHIRRGANHTQPLRIRLSRGLRFAGLLGCFFCRAPRMPFCSVGAFRFSGT